MKKLLILAMLTAETATAANFRVTPYVQHPSTNAMSILWLTDASGAATIEWSSVRSLPVESTRVTDAPLPTDLNNKKI